jgi:hypothetical protein
MIFRTMLVAMLYLGGAVLAMLPSVSNAEEAEDFSNSLRIPRPENRTKQKESFSSGACVVESGAFPVGFNAYVVPDGDHPSYPPFCSPVPAGPLNIVMDLFAPELREYPLAVRLMKVEGGEEREVLSVPAQEYESGNIALAVDLEPLAKYNILLIGNNEAGDPETLVTIPLEVRRAGDFVHTSKGTGWGFLVMVVALAGLVGGLIHRWNPKKPAG